MKTMTCRQLGGPCDLEHHGETANDVIKTQDLHLKEAVAGGDETHADALLGHAGPVEEAAIGDGLVPKGQA